MFKKKYDIEKMTFITLTDGGANSFHKRLHTPDIEKHSDEWYSSKVDWDSSAVINCGKNKIVTEAYGNLTNKLLQLIKKTNDANIIGFYILKRVKRWDIEKYFKDAKDFNDRQKKYDIARKQMTKDKAIAVDKEGYNKYFLLDGKKMKVENFDLTEAKVNKGTTSELKRIFGKSMANRLVSRVVLNKFIQEVA
jgi:hypothetical protein